MYPGTRRHGGERIDARPEAVHLRGWLSVLQMRHSPMLASFLQLALLVVVSLPSWRKGGVKGFVRYVGAAVCLTALAIVLVASGWKRCKES